MEEELAAIRRWEGTVRALVGWDPVRAQERLERCDDGLLRGWSLGVKDIIDVQGMPTRCNVDFTPETPAQKDAAIVRRLLSLGAFVLSKTVTTSFAFLDPGVTRNPWNPDYTPGGSSSGSAAAVACGMVRLALGSQTVSSVNRPASYCGVTGFKPTFGRLPMTGIFPFSPSVDTVGLFTRGVSDMQQAASALLGERAAGEPGRLRVGLVSDLHTQSAEGVMLRALLEAGDCLAAEGCEVKRVNLPRDCAAAYQNHFDLIAFEAARGHAELLTLHEDRYPPRLRALLMEGRQVTPESLDRIQEHRRSLKVVLSELWEKVDLVVSPSAEGPAPRGLTKTGDPRFSLLWTYAGYPTVTLPVTLSPEGLPLGLQLVGRCMADGDLLAAARKVEAMLGFCARPR